jgi:hypothetical protein
VTLVAAPTGVGKTLATARMVAEHGRAIWLADRHQDVVSVAEIIEGFGGSVGRLAILTENQPDGTPNCLHPRDIRRWQDKGYEYRPGFCECKCLRRGVISECPFLASLDGLESADSIVVTKALAREPGFFSGRGNPGRDTVVIDEDPVGLLRRPVTLTRAELDALMVTLDQIIDEFRSRGQVLGVEAAQALRRIAEWCRDAIELVPFGSPPAVFPVPRNLASAAGGDEEDAGRKEGRKLLRKSFHALMRRYPIGTVRNLARDLRELIHRAADGVALVTPNDLTFHIATAIPRNKRVIVLDATASPELLAPLFAPRQIETLCAERVEPVGRVVQFMDFNGPRCYLDRIPKNVVRIIDALGDRHPDGRIILIGHKSNVHQLRLASRHAERIVVAHFGALRGRNDLMSGPSGPVACHVVIGSPKTTEAARQRLALAIFGEEILPFPPLESIRRLVVGRVPRELIGDGFPEIRRIWEAWHKGYSDPRMQAVYDHTVAAELAHAADRARVLSQPTTVYLLTNEACPWLWFSEMCFADEYLALPMQRRSDYESNYRRFADKALGMLHEGQEITGPSVCRAMGEAGTWGKRYWSQFRLENAGLLEGQRKVKMKAS